MMLTNTFKAKYGGKCGQCPNPIKVGQVIRSRCIDGFHSYVHSDCSAALAIGEDEVCTLLRTNPVAVEHAVLALYKRQTDTEQMLADSVIRNYRGFNKPDAMALSSVAERLLNGEHLQPVECAATMRRVMKYSAQLAAIAAANMRK